MADSVFVDGIEIEGNKRTKDWIILRELSFKQGDKLKSTQLDSLLKVESNRVFNTDLFIISTIDYQQKSTTQVQIKVKVIERWYFYLIPVLDVADRNFNEWLRDRDRDFSRLVYGVSFKQKNFRGRNESIKLGAKLGFNRSINLSYSIPYIDKQRTISIATLVKYTTNNGVAYQTVGNKLAFFESEAINRKRFDASIGLGKRVGFYTNHSLKIGFKNHWVSDSISQLNPNYFLDGSNNVQMIELAYRFSRDFRDVRAYPLEGHLLEVDVEKQGLGIFNELDIWATKAHYSKFTKLSKRLFMANTFRGKLSSPQQPYGFQRGLGFRQEFVRGYDLYVIDAQQYLLNRNTLRWMFFDKTLNIKKIVPLEQFNTVPLKIFAKAFFDHAYSNNRFVSTEANTLDNRWLYGGGVGLDFVTFYNSTIRLEFSMNGRGESGLFYYYSADF